MQQKLQANAEAMEFANRELAELTSGSSRTERDAVIVVDKGERGGQGAAQLSGHRRDLAAAVPVPRWRREGPRPARISRGDRAADRVKTGRDVDMTLSTAQPQLNATPPELLALDITVVGRGAGFPGQPGRQQGGANGQA